MRNENSILYIDSNTRNLDIFIREFQDKFSVHATTSIDRAWDILNELEIKVFICAHQMPDISSLDIIEQVHATYPFISNILFSEFSDNELLLDAINREGLYKLVLRPWKEHDLFLSLQNAAERYNLITERARLIEDLKEQNKQLIQERIKSEESARLKTAFLGNISHEIRTPMNAIIGFSELLLNDNLKKAQKESYASVVNSSCKNLLNTLDDIIMLSQLHAGLYRKVEIVCSLNDLKLFTERRLAYYFCKYDSKKVVTRVKAGSQNTIIKCPVDGVKAIISKLVDNACKYTLKGSVDVAFEIEEGLVGYWLKIIVRDTGIGIAKANHEKIFEAFYQLLAQEGQLNSGNGIGLSIVMAQINNMEGHIELDSAPGKGSTFICRVPIQTQN